MITDTSLHEQPPATARMGFGLAGFILNDSDSKGLLYLLSQEDFCDTVPVLMAWHPPQQAPCSYKWVWILLSVL